MEMSDWARVFAAVYGPWGKDGYSKKHPGTRIDVSDNSLVVTVDCRLHIWARCLDGEWHAAASLFDGVFDEDDLKRIGTIDRMTNGEFTRAQERDVALWARDGEHRLVVQGPPVIGETPRKRVRYWLWRQAFGVGMSLWSRFGRFVPAGSSYDDCCTDHYERKHWGWVGRAADGIVDADAQPIYDPNWVRPKPVTMEWGWRNTDGDMAHATPEPVPEQDYNYFLEFNPPNVWKEGCGRKGLEVDERRDGKDVAGSGGPT